MIVMVMVQRTLYIDKLKKMKDKKIHSYL